jgi:hypothetical protein
MTQQKRIGDDPGSSLGSSGFSAILMRDICLIRDFAIRVAVAVREAFHQIAAALSPRVSRCNAYLMEFAAFAVLHQIFGSAVHRIQNAWNYTHRWWQGETIAGLSAKNFQLEAQNRDLERQLAMATSQGFTLVVEGDKQRQATLAYMQAQDHERRALGVQERILQVLSQPQTRIPWPLLDSQQCEMVLDVSRKEDVLRLFRVLMETAGNLAAAVQDDGISRDDLKGRAQLLQGAIFGLKKAMEQHGNS